MNVTTDDYRALARLLPRPTLGQTVRFAWFVSGAHSWYKHLPLDRFVEFQFYLDPHAGMSSVNLPGGESLYAEITDESPRFHYTWQTTSTYRRRFGYWRYLRVDRPGPHIGLLVNNTFRHTDTCEASIVSASGATVPVPRSLLMKGAARVNAFVHPDTDIRHVGHLAALYRDSAIAPPVAEDRSPNSFRAELDELLSEIARDDEQLADYRPILEDFRMLFDHPWDQNWLAAGISEAELRDACAALQREWLEVRLQKMKKILKTVMSEDPGDDLRALALERDRQLTGIWTAMLDFLAALDAPA